MSAFSLMALALGLVWQRCSVSTYYVELVSDKS